MTRFKALAQHLPGSNGEDQISKEDIRRIFKHVYLKLNSLGRPYNGLLTTGLLGTGAQTFQRCKKKKKNDHDHDHEYDDDGCEQNEEEYDGYNDVNDIMIMIRAQNTKETGQNGHGPGM